MSKSLIRELAAEFLGTFVLIAFGVAVVAQVVLSREANGTFLSINLAWGAAVTMGVYVAGGVSGRTSTRRLPLRWPFIEDSPGQR